MAYWKTKYINNLCKLIYSVNETVEVVYIQVFIIIKLLGLKINKDIIKYMVMGETHEMKNGY